MNKIAIVVVGYNRKESLSRLITSIKEAEFYEDRVDLIISLDKSNIENDMIAMANTVEWSQGDKRIRTFPERQGLRSHILQCGDLTDEYDAVIVLEDDLIVSKGFYSYVKQCLNYYQDDDRIAGISLYSFQVSPGVLRPFQPASAGYDVFLLSFAQSWGQCWTRKMWVSFKEWYSKQVGHLESNGIMPDYIEKWDDRSWLKYYMKYTAENGLYFVYPYISLTTNFTESGEHNSASNASFQVPLLESDMTYRFPPKGNEILYDSFMERIFSKDTCLHLNGKIVIDLYGMKSSFNDNDYLISTREHPYTIIEELGLNFRPHEENIRFWNKGKGIFVYDLRKPTRGIPKADKSLVMQYDLRAIGWKKVLRYGIHGMLDTVYRKLHR